MAGYRRALVRDLVSHLRPIYGADNWDDDRFGGPPRPVEVRNGPAGPRTFTRIVAGRGLARTYERLADRSSREALVDVMSFHALGYRRKRLRLNTPAYHDLRARARALEVDGLALDAGFLGWDLPLFDLGPSGFPVRLHTRASAVACTYLQEHYRYQHAPVNIAARPGDHVIDAGACWGDTALFFAHAVGPTGRVHAVELVPSNLDILSRNLALNPELAPRIGVVARPLDAASGIPLWFDGRGPATRVSPTPLGPESVEVRSTTIDDLVADGTVPRVDFVKMDIEGAEVAALRGAERTLRSFRPRLAISLYHRLSDFWTVPDFLASLDLGYRFYLDHYTIHREETVLFAEAV